MARGGFLIFRHLFLNALEEFFRNNCGKGVRLDDLSETIFSEIAAAFQHMMNDIEGERVALDGFDPAAVKIFDDFRHHLALGVARKRFHDKGRGFLVDFKSALFGEPVPHGDGAAVDLSFQRIFGQSTVDFLREFHRIVLCIAFR